MVKTIDKQLCLQLNSVKNLNEDECSNRGLGNKFSNNEIPHCLRISHNNLKWIDCSAPIQRTILKHSYGLSMMDI